MPGRRKAFLTIGSLTKSFAGRATPRDPWRFVLTFNRVGGLASVGGREARAVITPRELAEVLGAIPALEMDESDYKAFLRVRQILYRMESKES